MILLDTNVLAHAVGVEAPIREQCRRVLQAVGDGSVRASTTIEAIQEFAHVRARRAGRPEAVQLASGFASLLAPLIQPDAEDLGVGLEIFLTTPGVGAFDAVLAAVVLHRPQFNALMSADRGFVGVKGLNVIHPEDWSA